MKAAIPSISQFLSIMHWINISCHPPSSLVHVMVAMCLGCSVTLDTTVKLINTKIVGLLDGLIISAWMSVTAPSQL